MCEGVEYAYDDNDSDNSDANDMNDDHNFIDRENPKATSVTAITKEI